MTKALAGFEPVKPIDRWASGRRWACEPWVHVRGEGPSKGRSPMGTRNQLVKAQLEGEQGEEASSPEAVRRTRRKAELEATASMSEAQDLNHRQT